MTNTKTKKNKNNKSQLNEDDEEISNNVIYKKLREMEKSLEFMSAQFEQIRNENKEIKQIMKENEKENKELKERINTLETLMEQIEKENIKNNIIINGIDIQGKQENTTEVVNNILKKLNIIPEGKIEKCYRKNQQQEKSPIVVKLKNEETKIEILKTRKTIGEITTKDCLLKGKGSQIYINEQLTNKINNIFFHTRELKKNKKIAFAWTRDGNIYAKKTETSQKVKIKSMEDLQDLQN